ncbi:MARCH6 [Mytilus coruscus]|uniref:E3 ubiquitin-protein ligase MARCHF6 n=1 Tax=Mytilus coruscus TaxID=42192 RepID=A0A6J8E667_MYTCO|nr:MARCH6 [Mytilus coruscus]
MDEPLDPDGLLDICRVCRCESTPDKPLFHPCVCTGSIKFVHQECLVQWLKYSRKEYCELCKHRFAFTPIYSPDMPKRLPVKDIFGGLLKSIGRAVRYWLHYTLVAFAWLGVVPLTACRIYRCLFTGSVSSLLTLPLDMLSTENIASDCFYGCFVVTCTLCAFISLVWLREQILHGGGPEWLEQDDQGQNPQRNFLDAGMVNNLVGGFGGGAPRAAPANQNEDNNQQAPAAGELNEEEVEDDGIEGGNNGNNAAQDEINWNPIEWDRAAEELTWERLLGLDGSLVFLEHVFWVVSLNTLFILVFAFCPFHIGHFTLVGLRLDDIMESTHYEGLLTTMIGYIVIAFSLVVLYMLCAIARLKKFRRVLGLCYIVVKVMLLVVIEIGVFPLICGWWLDICSLSMFDATLKDRKNSFHLAPGTSMFIHWLVGMVYVFYFASFILLLREVLRPGVLWFLRNLNDPEFNPIQEMIHLPVYRHARRFTASVIIFGSTVLLMLWLPVRVVRKIFTGFLPYHVMLSSDAPVSELSLELLLLQVVLPALLEQGHTRMWLKGMVRGWTLGMAYILGLRSYLLGDVPINNSDNVVEGDQPVQHPAPANLPQPQPGGLGAAHQAMLQGGGPTGFQAYKRPSIFHFRIVLLVLLMCFTLFVCSLLSLVLPGKLLLKIIHASSDKAMKCFIVAALLIGFVPLLLGLLFELVIVAPLRVPLDQSPIFFPWQDWALGVLHAKIVCAITMMGPQWWLKRVIEQIYNDGIRNINLRFIITKLCAPVIGVLGMSLAAPYVVANSIVPFLGFGFEAQVLVLRRIYPCLLACLIIVLFGVFQARQFRRLYEHIKNDKYLVGQRLVNYDSRRLIQLPPPRLQSS